MKFLVDELPYYGEYCPFASKMKFSNEEES